MRYWGIVFGVVVSSFVFLSNLASAEDKGWVLDAGSSKVSYISIKKDTVGEINSFEKLSGSVTSEGDVTVNIDVTSVQTNIDIRNERMIAHVFDASKPTATLKTKIDIAALSALKVGDTTVSDVEGKLNLSGVEVDVETSMFIARLSEKKVLVTTDEMIVVSTEDLGVNAGIDKLMELAKLPGITRVAPVSLRLVFTSETAQAAAPAAKTEETQVALATTGDDAAGKKVFRRCKACHEADKAKNKVGPHLNGVVGRQVASIDGFKYSKALKGADLVWNEENLTKFLAKPRAFIKGNKMSFAGLKKEKDIENVIAYLKSVAN